MIFDQAEFDLRCEWGSAGVAQLAPISDVVVIVDVLSFSTAVDIAVSRGAQVFPFAGTRDEAEAFGREHTAVVAEKVRTQSGFSLSPASLVSAPSGLRLVLPSPNGSSLSLSTGDKPTFTACLRNATAVARAAQLVGLSIAVIPAGERWPDGSLRPCIEDWIGAGAVLAALPGRRSPEAGLAIAAFQAYDPELSQRCSSAKELIERGFVRDVELATEINVSCYAPALNREDEPPFFA